VSPGGRAPRRGWAAGVALATVALLIVVVIRAEGGTPASAASANASPAAAASGTAEPFQIYAAHGSASLVPALQGRRPLFILSLGSDARPGQEITRQRSDSIHLIGIDPATHRATILGFPRDSYVSIPGHGTNKINSAMSAGGPQLLIDTIERLTGIHVDFWMLTSFPGIVNMVNRIGGLDVVVPYPMHDSFSHANFNPGRTHLNGKRALAFARDRHDVPGGDLGRSHDQGILLLAALAKFRKGFSRDPATAFTWIQAGWNEVKTNLPVATLLELALTASQIRPADVNNLVVPASGGSVGGLSVVFLQSSANAEFADMRADGVVDHPPGG
jgi:LCP family protein required for cell wall assembly